MNPTISGWLFCGTDGDGTLKRNWYVLKGNTLHAMKEKPVQLNRVREVQARINCTERAIAISN